MADRRFHLTAADLAPFVGQEVSLNRRLPEGFVVVEDAFLVDVEPDFLHYIPGESMGVSIVSLDQFERVEGR